MTKRILLLCVTVTIFAGLAFAGSAARLHEPTFVAQQSGTTNGLIAVSPVNPQIVWAAGRAGTFVVTTDGGETWKVGVVPGAETLQFRDVQGVTDKIAYLLSIGNGTDSRIYKTVDGGATWTLEFENQIPDAFYDCMAFWTPNRGLAHSDSVSGVFPELRTTNGSNWVNIGSSMPPALPGEASFASSGTCVATQGGQRAWVGTGGASPSRILATTDGGDTWNAYATPLRGSPSAGVFTVAFRNAKDGFIGGGDLDPEQPPAPQTARSTDGGKTWMLTASQPNIGTVFGLSYVQGTGNGCSCGDAGAEGHAVVVTGPGGVAWTPDEGMTWHTVPDLTGFWAVAFASPKAGWLVGTGGRIVKISF